MRRGPSGVEVETELELSAKRKWGFSREYLIKRLGLPDDAVLTIVGEPIGLDDNEVGVKVELSGDARLKATASEVRKPGPKIAGNA